MITEMIFYERVCVCVCVRVVLDKEIQKKGKNSKKKTFFDKKGWLLVGWRIERVRERDKEETTIKMILEYWSMKETQKVSGDDHQVVAAATTMMTTILQWWNYWML